MADAPDVRASARFFPISPQKARLVVDLIRGRDATQALQMLLFEPKAGARPIAKLLRSAIANAEQNFGMSQEDLVISEAYADGAPSRRWRRFGARGRFKPIRRRYSHITLVLREREEAASSRS